MSAVPEAIPPLDDVLDSGELALLEGVPPGVKVFVGSVISEIWTKGTFTGLYLKGDSLPGIQASFSLGNSSRHPFRAELRRLDDGYLGVAQAYDPGLRTKLTEKSIFRGFLLEYGLAMTQFLAVKAVAEMIERPLNFYVTQRRTEIADLGDCVGRDIDNPDWKDVPELDEGWEQVSYAMTHPAPFSHYSDIADMLGFEQKVGFKKGEYVARIVIPPNGFYAPAWLTMNGMRLENLRTTFK